MMSVIFQTTFFIMKLSSNPIRNIFLALCAATLCGCASYTPSISPDEGVASNAAYLYGRFSIDARKFALGLDGHQTMGFVFKCADDQSYTLRFSRDTPVQVIKIAPSRCAFSEIVYSDVDGVVKSRKPAPPSAKNWDVYESGKAYYLGDFFAGGTTSVSYRTVHMRWEIRSIKNDFLATTEEMKRNFPKFAPIQTENRMLGSGHIGQ